MSNTDVNSEVNISLRLTGREVYRAVKNFVRDELKLDPDELKRNARDEADRTVKTAVEHHLRTTYTKPNDIESVVRRMIYDLIMHDSKEAIRKEITWAVSKIVAEKRAAIEKAIREHLDDTSNGVMAGIVKEAIAKATGKR